MPVTNRVNTNADNYHFVNNTGAVIQKISSANGVYYLAGDFSNLTYNHGPALVIDSATNAIKTSPQWRINGTVFTAIPDGQGGFYIGGDFTRIGDSTRNYIAQIDANGQPTAWAPQADSTINMLQARNDTLYIAGDFSKIFSRSKNCFAIYSIKGDSLVNSRIAGFQSINSFLLQKDSIILAGKGMSPIRKYSIKDSLINFYWQLSYVEYGPMSLLQFNNDSSVVAYRSEYNQHTLKAFNASTGALKYTIELSMYWPDGFDSGRFFSMKAVGNKMYVAGYFEEVKTPAGIANRKGFFSFDGTTGVLSNDQLQIAGYPTFVESKNGKLFISGSFDTINSVARMNFAVLDTGSFSVNQWQLSPSDGLTAFAMDNKNTFIGGYFNGIGAVRRHGLAAVDSVTGAILPWSPSMPASGGIKRMMIQGDTLFMLSFEHSIGCNGSPFKTDLLMYRLSDGTKLTVPRIGNLIYDFIVDGDDLYLSYDNELRRFYLANMKKDVAWGTTLRTDNAPIQLMIRDNRIYSIGDSRYYLSCSSEPNRKAWVSIFDKATGLALTSYSYQGRNNDGSNVILFNHALLVNDKMYVHGNFFTINEKDRQDFVCIDINTGGITDWQTSFKLPESRFLSQISDMKLFNGQLWFGCLSQNDDDGNLLTGLVAVDTTIGVLMPPVVTFDTKPMGYTPQGKFAKVYDLLFTDKTLIAAGSFDVVNGEDVTSITGMPLKPVTSSPIAPVTIQGADTIYTDSKPNKYYIIPSDPRSNGYHWIYNGNGVTITNNGKDTIKISAANNATSGDLTVKAVNFCSDKPVTIAQKHIVLIAPPPPLPVPDVSGISDKCFSETTTYAKVNNPPAEAEVTVLVDGSPVSYHPADSTFPYFVKGQTATGYHIVNVKYRYKFYSMDTVHTNITYYVTANATPGITIAGNTTVKDGNETLLTASATYAGDSPVYQWQDSTRLHIWQNITGATQRELTYMPDTTGVKVRCLLTSNAVCALTNQVVSNSLSFVVDMVTGINDPNDESKHILIYPNPVLETIIVDSLRAEENWEAAEIVNIHGQKVLPAVSIKNTTRVGIPVKTLNKGVYILLLRRRSGAMAARTFIKQ